MSDKEILDFSQRIQYGLDLAERRMLEEKALHGQRIVVCTKDDKIKYVPACKAIDKLH